MKNPNQKKKLAKGPKDSTHIIPVTVKEGDSELRIAMKLIESLNSELDNALEILHECRSILYAMPVNSPEESLKKNDLLRRANQALSKIPIQPKPKSIDS